VRVPRHQYRSRRAARQDTPRGEPGLSNPDSPSEAPYNSPETQTTSVISQDGTGSHMRPNDPGRRGNGPRGRGRGGARSGRRGGPGTHTMSGTGRAFGGQLTRSEAPVGSLQADAPEFRPGQPVQPRQ
jgi:hypothetical protein